MIRGLLMVVIDCLRADHVSSYGYHRETTPTIDGLASRGVRWANAFSASCWTKPSVASMFTGLYPSAHGALDGIRRKGTEGTVVTDPIRSSEVTLAEDLSARGWCCAAFMNNLQLGPFSRLNRGFETFEAEAGKAEKILTRFESWLRERAGEPWFAYLHFLEAHWPYRPRRRHVELFGGDRDANPFSGLRARDYARMRRSISRKESSLTDVEVAQMMQMYDGAIRRLDGKIRKLLTLLERTGEREHTVVAVTADHGEEFLEHGKIGHGQSLYDELVHVPLVVSWPGGPRGIIDQRPASHVDLGHTLVRLLANDANMPGCDLLSDDQEVRPIFGEVKQRLWYRQSVRCGRWKCHRTFRFSTDPHELAPAQSPCEWPANVPHTVKVELYDLAKDHQEKNDLADNQSFAGIQKDLTDQLDVWWSQACANHSHAAADEVLLDAGVTQRLRDLGYLE